MSAWVLWGGEDLDGWDLWVLVFQNTTLGQIWAKNCLCNSQRPYRTYCTEETVRGRGREGEETVRAVAVFPPHSSTGHICAGALKSYLLVPQYLTYRGKRSQGPGTAMHPKATLARGLLVASARARKN